MVVVHRETPNLTFFFLRALCASVLKFFGCVLFRLKKQQRRQRRGMKSPG